jgi:hypothetical protein
MNLSLEQLERLIKQQREGVVSKHVRVLVKKFMKAEALAKEKSV